MSVLGASRVDRFCLDRILPYFTWGSSEGNKSHLQGHLLAYDGNAVSNQRELGLIVNENEDGYGYSEIYPYFQLPSSISGWP